MVASVAKIDAGLHLQDEASVLRALPARSCSRGSLMLSDERNLSVPVHSLEDSVAPAGFSALLNISCELLNTCCI